MMVTAVGVGFGANRAFTCSARFGGNHFSPVKALRADDSGSNTRAFPFPGAERVSTK